MEKEYFLEFKEKEVYTYSTAKSAWNNAYEQNLLFLDREHLAILTDAMVSSERVSTQLPLSSSVYFGRWNSQANQQTCTVWSYVNALRVIDEVPNFSLLSNLLNYSNGHNEEGTKGVPTAKLLEFIDSGNTTLKPKITQASLEKVTTDDKAEIVKSKAEIIKNSLDSGQAILARVDLKIFQSKHSKTRRIIPHAVCVSGYSIEEKFSAMNVQLIDPLIGVVWTSLEHFSNSSISGEFYTFSK